MLGLSDLASHLNVDSRDSGVSGNFNMIKESSFKKSPSTIPDSFLLVLLLTWNLISPSFRVRDYIAGHKSSLLSAGGVTLTLSLFFSLSMNIGVACFLGHASIFLVPLPLSILALVILLAKSIVDPDFQKQPMAQRISYSLLAGIFPISSRRPTDEEDQNIAKHKNSSSELLLLHLIHFLNTLVWAVVYAALMETSPAFSEAMGKIEQANGLNSSWVIFLACPLACGFSILARVIYNQVEPWSIVNSAVKRGCCSCCPPTLRSSFKTATFEDPQDPETPAAEVEEMLGYLADNRS